MSTPTTAMRPTNAAPAVSPVHNIRWMVRQDFEQVTDIEFDCFDVPWVRDDFIRCLRQRNCIGLVAMATDNVTVLGFVVYELRKNRLFILNFAVKPEFWRRGVGRALVSKLTDKLSANHRSEIDCEIRERNVRAQLFFKAMGFQPVCVIHQWYEDTSEDCYQFRFQLER